MQLLICTSIKPCTCHFLVSQVQVGFAIQNLPIAAILPFECTRLNTAADFACPGHTLGHGQHMAACRPGKAVHLEQLSRMQSLMLASTRPHCLPPAPPSNPQPPPPLVEP